ncbi:MAG: radical SAM protein [Clostridia bacterium]|nr:radical SAM protein [Clostridia bacterium]
MNCDICPRNCKVNRESQIGFCGQNEKVRISKVMFHHYEEPLISGKPNSKGSGAIFFTGCNLRCAFCQNFPISHGNKGKTISTKGLAKLFKKLEKKGALNINLVTPSHFSMQIIEALNIYKPNIPIVWNSNGYETKETIKKLKDYVDVYLVDLKYMDNELSKKYSKATNYVENATEAIMQMKKNQPQDVIENNLIKKGLIIRHLILPTHSNDSIKCLDFIHDKIGEDSIVSIMSQYEPRYKAKEYPEINRKITPLEYKRVVSHAIKLNMSNCFTQDLSSADSKYTPKF